MKRIIIVDDDPTNNHVIETMIRKLIKGMEIITFINPEKALEYLITHPTDFNGLVLVDVNMPEMSGWQFIEMMHKNEIMAPVIVLTSSISFQDKETAHSIEEVKGFFVKPIDTGMINKIKELILN